MHTTLTLSRLSSVFAVRLLASASAAVILAACTDAGSGVGPNDDSPASEESDLSAREWTAAQHYYDGWIYAVTDDTRHALVAFEGLGFGGLDLRTYRFTSYGDMDALGNVRAEFVANEKHVLLSLPAPFPGMSEKGLQLTLRDLTDPTKVETIMRPPRAGAGDLYFGFDRKMCPDGRAQWTEYGVRITLTPNHGTHSITEGDEPLNCHLGVPDYPPNVFERTDRKFATAQKFAAGELQTCSEGRCTAVRTLPPGVKWVLFSKSGDRIAYRINGHVYRDTLSGGAVTELPFMDYALNERDGKLLSTTSVRDIDTEITTPLVEEADIVEYSDEETHPFYLPNGMTAIQAKNGGYILINAQSTSVHVDTSRAPFSGQWQQKRPGVSMDGWHWIF